MTGVPRDPEPAGRPRRRRWPALVLYAVSMVVAVQVGLIVLLVDSGGDIARGLVNAEVWVISGVGALVILAAQAVLLWPVRKPAPRAARGVSAWCSVLVAGLGAGLLAVGLVAGLVTLTGMALGSGQPYAPPFMRGWDGWQVFVLSGVVLLAGWAGGTVLVLGYLRRHRAEDGLARFASRLVLGTGLEVLAGVPLHLMVRRRSECHCAEGSFLTLLVCLGVGLFAIGPAVLLPMLSRRRARWYGARCPACLYDMAATPGAERCPECGAGWRAPAASGG